MLAVELPSAHAGQQRTWRCHAAVAVIRRIEIDEPFVTNLVAIGRKARLANDELQLVLERGQIARDLCIKALSQRHRSVEYVLRWHAPGIGLDLQSLVMPPAVLTHALDILVGERLPRCVFVERELVIEQRGLQLNESGNLAINARALRILERCAERHQQVAEGVVA